MIGTTPYVPLIGACDYLNCLGDAIVGWLQLRMAIEATKKFFDSATNEKEKAFYRGKIEGAKFFINRITGLVAPKLENLKKDESSMEYWIHNKTTSKYTTKSHFYHF